MTTQFIRISKQAARKLFAEGDKMVCLCPCKLRPGFPFAPHVAISGREYIENATNSLARDGIDDKKQILSKAWDLLYNNWAYYNTSDEAGHYATYYIER